MSIEDLVNDSTRDLSDVLTARRAFITRVLEALRGNGIPEPDIVSNARGEPGSSDTTRLDATWNLTIAEETKPNHEYTVIVTLGATSDGGIAIRIIQATGYGNFAFNMQNGGAAITVPVLKSLLKILYESRDKKVEPPPPLPTREVDTSLDI